MSRPDVKAEDMKILKHAGLFGSRYCVVVGEPKKRWLKYESTSLRRAEKATCEFVDPRVYTKVKGEWTECASI